MDPSVISNKNFQPVVRMTAYSIDGELDTTSEVWRVDKRQFKKVLKEKLEWSYYRIKKFIQVYIDMNIIKENDVQYEFSKVDTTLAWTKLNMGTVFYCLQYLSDFSIKVYCLLLYRYNKYRYNHPYTDKPFKFSCAQICRGLGLSVTNPDNTVAVKGALETLSNLDLIRYNPGPFYERNAEKNATVPWMYLYKVNEYSKAQKNVANQLSKEEKENIGNDIKAMFTIPKKESLKQFEEKSQVQEKKPYSTEIVVEEFNGEKILDGKRWYDLDNNTREFNHEDGFNELCLAIRGFCLGEDYSIEKSSKLSQLSIKIWGKDYTTVLEEKPDYSDLF